MLGTENKVWATRVQACRVWQTRAMKTSPLKLCTAGLAIALVSAGALAQSVPPSYGHDFVTVGAAGNRGTLPSERPWADRPDVPVGSIAYEFRVTRTEVSANQWLEFARAYAPFASDDDRILLGAGVVTDSSGLFELIPPFATHAAQPNFPLAARYCNWLHNDKASTVEAFVTGAYDASLFVPGADGRFPIQGTRLPGARFWIPSVEETIKAFYFDPNRYGLDQPGYWLFPTTSNALPISAPPQLGGTTNSGVTDLRYWGVGAYPHVTTPWGLLDASGGAREMTENLENPGRPNQTYRFVIGSAKGGDPGFADYSDRIDAILNTSQLAFTTAGFRVASVIPAPSTVLPCLTVVLLLRRRRCA